MLRFNDKVYLRSKILLEQNLFVFHRLQVTRDNQQITALELKMTTQKSRVTELEGSLNLSQESTNKVRKQGLLDQEKLAVTMKEVCQYAQLTRYDRILEKPFNWWITQLF